MPDYSEAVQRKLTAVRQEAAQAESNAYAECCAGCARAAELKTWESHLAEALAALEPFVFLPGVLEGKDDNEVVCPEFMVGDLRRLARVLGIEQEG